ncbi:MAG: outer membrane protein assembly factor BamA [Aquisalimonadaceae bacterium]
MRKLQAYCATLLLCLIWVTPIPAYAFDPFVVTDIRVEGLRRISPGTVFNYLPVEAGDRIDPQRVTEAIRSLYATGFFQDVAMERDDDVLVVNLVERPAIARVEIFGNDAIDSEPLMEALREIGLADGETFNRSLLENVENELKAQYFSQGNYDVAISSTVSPLPRNRVGIRIDVDEGEVARIREVRIVGNRKFRDEELKDIFTMGPRPWYLPFSRRDRYSRERLGGDLESLRSHYLNRGYVDFSVTSTQVSLTPDRRGVFITVNVSEGERYRIGDLELAGDLIVGEDALRELIDVQEGDIFSDTRVTDIAQKLRDRLGVEGYAFTNVNPIPDVDRENRIVNLTYYVDPGQRTYVRRINISGNYRTDDEVIRREIRQMEGGWFSSEKILLSRNRLNRLGFFDAVDVETPRVPGEPDQVDVNINVEEGLSGNLQAGIGYGSGQGVLLNFSVAQDNLLGTGDRAVIAANNSRYSRLYQFTYTQRYYTIDGVSRSFSALLQDTDAGLQRLSDYTLRTGSVGVGFGIPLNEEDEIRVDFSVEELNLRLRRDTPIELRDFVGEFGDRYRNYKAGLSWNRNSTDRLVFPTTGGIQSLGAEVSVPGSELRYYKLSYSHRRYIGLTENTSLSLLGRVGYGAGYGETSQLPFFENFFTGGINSVRGYRASSLGPRYAGDNRPTGGNLRVNGSVEYYFPIPLIDSPAVRFSTFLDAGQVYDTKDDAEVDLDQLRYSAGVAFTWMSPLGALTMSWGNPLNDERDDEADRFQFSLGSIF